MTIQIMSSHDTQMALQVETNYFATITEEKGLEDDSVPSLCVAGHA